MQKNCPLWLLHYYVLYQWIIITDALMQSRDFTVVVGCREDIFFKTFFV